MKNSNLLKTGITCSCVSALCCFTPALVIALGALGLTAVVATLDFVLIPALMVSLAVTIYALIQRQRLRAHADDRA